MAINVKDKLVTLESLGIAYSAEQDSIQETKQELSARIDNIITPQGDPSLTEVSDARVSGSTTYNTLKARLDADKASVSTEIAEIKADLDAVTGVTPLEMTAGYLTCNTGVGTIVDTDNPTESENFQYSITQCVEGDKFLISGNGGNAPRLWCFLDSSKAIISVSGTSFTAENLIITAPEDSAYCIVNSNDKTKISYKGVLINIRVDEISNGVSNALSDLADISQREVLTDVVVQKQSGETEYPSSVSVTNGYIRGMGVSNPGNLTGTSSANNKTFSYLATEDMDVYVINTNGSTQQIGVFEGAPYGASYRVSPIYNSSSDEYPLPTINNPIHVKAGQYVSFSYYLSQLTIEQIKWTLFKVADGNAKLLQTIPLTTEMSSEVDEKIIDVNVKGYIQIDDSAWGRNGWTGYTSTDSRSYRVRCKIPLVFSEDTILLVSEGFYLNGYIEGSSSDIDVQTTYVLKANTPMHLYIRRITEDSSEVANISEFASALKIQTKMSDIAIYNPTFSDVSMFERVGICGDSYAGGGGIISGIRRLTWGKNLERQAGVTVDIYAKSGQNVVGWVTDATNGLPALLAGTECGLYWMQHGINGTSTAESLGTPEDMSADPRPQTFYGQYVEAIEQIKTAFPNARIVVATITGTGYNLYQTQYKNANTAIKAIAEYCNVPLIDVVDDAFYRSKFYDNYTRSAHPTAMQNAGVAMANRRLISRCIQANPSYFINYGSNS